MSGIRTLRLEEKEKHLVRDGSNKIKAKKLGGVMSYEGGFAGRSNKLVDGCYSFWQGGAMVIANSLYKKGHQGSQEDPWLTGSLSTNLLFDAPIICWSVTSYYVLKMFMGDCATSPGDLEIFIILPSTI